jgi:hypothetical protein
LLANQYIIIFSPNTIKDQLFKIAVCLLARAVRLTRTFQTIRPKNRRPSARQTIWQEPMPSRNRARAL